MKKNIALLLGLVLGFGFVSCSDNDNDDEDQSTRVEDQYLSEITTTRYEWKNGERSSEGKTYEIVRYNEKGQRVSGENLFYAIKISYENVYDDNGRLIETSHYDLINFHTNTRMNTILMVMCPLSLDPPEMAKCGV